MARTERRYARIYFDDLQRDYPAVWSDDAAFATYVRLLAIADASWPSPAILPRSVRPSVLRRLSSLIVVTDDTYQVKGYDAERAARQSSGRRGAEARWDAVRDANASANAHANASANAGADASADGDAAASAMHVPVLHRDRDQHRESARDGDTDRGEAPEWPALTWLAGHGCEIVPGNGYHRKLVTGTERHGVEAIIGALERLSSAGVRDGDVQGLLFGALDRLEAAKRPNLRAIETAERADQVTAAVGRRVIATLRRNHEAVGHLEPRPGCPLCPEAGAAGVTTPDSSSGPSLAANAATR